MEVVDDERTPLSKSWKRALIVRKNNFTTGLKQLKNNIDNDYNAFLRRQKLQKKKLVDDSERRQRVRKISRETVDNAFRRHDALTQSTEDLRKEITRAEDEILANGSLQIRPIARSLSAECRSPDMMRRGLRPRAYSRSAEDLRTLFGDKTTDKPWKEDSELKLPRLQPLPPLYTSTSSLAAINKTSPNGNQKRKMPRKSLSDGLLAPIFDKNLVTKTLPREKGFTHPNSNVIPQIMVTSHIANIAWPSNNHSESKDCAIASHKYATRKLSNNSTVNCSRRASLIKHFSSPDIPVHK